MFEVPSQQYLRFDLLVAFAAITQSLGLEKRLFLLRVREERRVTLESPHLIQYTPAGAAQLGWRIALQCFVSRDAIRRAEPKLVHDGLRRDQ